MDLDLPPDHVLLRDTIREFMEAEVAPVVGITEGQVEGVFQDIESKRRTTAFLHRKAVLVEDVPEIRVG